MELNSKEMKVTIMYAEIRNNYIWGPAVESSIAYPESGDMLATVTIDGWQTAQDDEDGSVIANVILTKHGDIAVDFHDNGTRMDAQVLTYISEAKAQLKELWHEKRAHRGCLPKGHTQGLQYRTVLYISAAELEVINKFLAAKTEDEYQGEDNTITYTAKFPDGQEMDIKCCGCKDESSWSEAVLFNAQGYQITCSDVEADFDGPWELEADGILYIVDVRVSDSENPDR